MSRDQRTVLYVDAGYIRSQLVAFAGGDGDGVADLDLSVAVKTLRHEMQRRLGRAVHRQRWYDGVADSGMTPQQRKLALAQGVILRQGRIGGESCARRQLAVDTLLVRDMVVDALRGDVTDAVLVSGDADMVPGVRELVNSGARVHVWGIVDLTGCARWLRAEADTTDVLAGRIFVAGPPTDRARPKPGLPLAGTPLQRRCPPPRFDRLDATLLPGRPLTWPTSARPLR